MMKIALCFCLLFAPLLVLAQAAPKVADPPPAVAPYKLTELQKARLDVARQKILRWQDRISEALAEYNQLCEDAQHENKWPEVRCNFDDLSVTSAAKPQPPTATLNTSPSPPGASGAPDPTKEAPKK